MPATYPSAAFSGPYIKAFALAGIASLLTASYIHKHRTLDDNKNTKNDGLRRTGAIRRLRRSASYRTTAPELDGAAPEELEDNVEPLSEDRAENGRTTLDDGEDETDISIPDADAEQVAANQSQQTEQSLLKKLTYEIAQNKETHEGVIHTGITCDACGDRPIRGVRYRCANCEDYDLCEVCEQNSEHVRTHVFYKIRVPCFWGPARIEPLWFPGLPNEMPRELPRQVLQEVSKTLEQSDVEYRLDEAEVKGLYQQFICLADQRFPTAQVEHSMCCGISLAAFRYLLPVTLRGTYAFNRLFAIFDQDKDDLISFHEFIHGVIICRYRRKNERFWQTSLFVALDSNDDGYVSRTDLIRLYDSVHEVDEDISLCHLQLYNDSHDHKHVEDRRTLRDYVDSNRPLPNHFSEQMVDVLHHHRSYPVYKQLSGASTIPYDDASGKELLFQGSIPDHAVPGRLLKTAASAFIRYELQEAFNELLDPIFLEHEAWAASWRLIRLFRQKHDALTRECLTFKERLLTLIGEQIGDDRDEYYRILDMENDVVVVGRMGDIPTDPRFSDYWSGVFGIVKGIYPTPGERNALARDVGNLAIAFAEMEIWQAWRRFQEAYAGWQASCWKPSLRHDTLDITSDLLAVMLWAFAGLMDLEEPETSPVHQGELADWQFWRLVERSHPNYRESQYRSDPLHLVDVMGLIMV